MPDISELEREFRRTWESYNLTRYPSFLARAPEDQKVALLAKLVAAEIEYAYRPPAHVLAAGEDRGHADEKEDALRPSLQILLAFFPELRQHTEHVISLASQEYALRLQHDPISPNPESYLPLCHDSRDHLCDLLLRIEKTLPAHRTIAPSMGRAGDSTVKDDSQANSIALDVLPNNLGSFLLIDFLNRGGMGVVYSAIDLRNAAPVAVKLMRRKDPWSIYRFIEEFGWLSRLNHPNLVKLYDACVDGDYRYFSMEIVDGLCVDEWFSRYIRGKENPWEPLKKVLIQAASAIQFLHRHGVLHCDIKCTNLMITSRRRAVLLDLGLSIREGSTESGSGTLQYTAPEVLHYKQHSTASDWYSFGLMIYEIICGGFNPRTRPISEADDPNATAVPFVFDEQDIREQARQADSDLVDLCCELICQKPEDRPTGDEVIDRLGGATVPNLITDHFVGRQQAIERLDSLERSTHRDNSSRVLFLRGESGVGKSSLLKHWLANRNEPDVLDLQLRCFRQDRTPLRLLTGIVQELVRTLERRSTKLWSKSLLEHIQEISFTFPQVQQLVKKDNSIQELPSSGKSLREREKLSSRHLMSWLAKLSRDASFLIVIDDAQWTDSPSLDWLCQLMQRSDFTCTLVISEDNSPADSEFPSVQDRLSNALRGSGRVDAASLRGKQVELEELELEPLSEKQLDALVVTWDSQDVVQAGRATPAEIRENIVERSHGNPFLLQELFLTYKYHSSRGSISDEDWLAENPDSNGLQSRISLLPAKVESILHYLAVADQPLSFHLLKTATRLKTHKLQPAINLLESQGWIHTRMDEGMSTIEIAHDRFRQAILSSLPHDRLQRRHFRVARTLGNVSPPPWSSMGNHYWIAEQYQEAAACYLQAAKQSARSGAYSEALEYLDRAKHQAASRNDEESLLVLDLEADCYTATGEFAKAAAVFDHLRDQAEDADGKLLYQCRSGDQWIRAGHVKNSLVHLRELLERIKFARLRRDYTAKLALRLRILGGLRTGANWNAMPREERPLDEFYRTLNLMTIPLTFYDNQFGPALMVRMKKLADTTGSDADRAISISQFGLLLAMNGGFFLKRGLTWLNRGRLLAKRSNSRTALAMYYFCWALVEIQYGRLPGFAKSYARALQWMEREPRKLQWELQFGAWCYYDYLWKTMDFQSGIALLEQARNREHTPQENQTEFFLHSGHAFQFLLVADDTENAKRSQALMEQDVATRDYQSPWFFAWLNSIQLALYEGRAELAQEMIERHWSRLSQAYLFSSQYYRFLALYHKLITWLQLAETDERNSLKLLRRCRTIAQQLRKLQSRNLARYGDAFLLVIDARGKKLSPVEDWFRVIEALEQDQHFCFANALRWQLDQYHAATSQAVSAEHAMKMAGCVAPAKLMNLLIPLPKAQHGQV